MANNYSQGTIWPPLPLTETQLEALDLPAIDIPKDEDKQSDAEKLRLSWVEGHATDEWASGLGSEPNTERVEDDKGRFHYKPDGRYYLFSEESGLGNGFDGVLQEILQGLPEKEYPYITYEYACTCSKMRPGEFGGGAMFITRDTINWTNSGSWLRQQEETFKEATNE